MLRSLFTAISGLQAHQKMLDVTANNIANVNTTGFKSSSAIFEDTLSQTLSNAGASNLVTGIGGTNAAQIGLGVHLAATNQNFAEGSPQATGAPGNLMINGDGFFAVSKNGQQYFTRAGAFTLDQDGHLVTPDGGLVDDNTPITPGTSPVPLDLSPLIPGNANYGGYLSWSIDSSGVVSGLSATGFPTVLGTVGVATFANPNGLQKAGDSKYVASASSGLATVGVPGVGSVGTLSEGSVEMSNVDLSQELTNLIVSERGFQANSKVITTSDEVLQTLVNLKS